MENLVILAGPTAVGKTNISIQIAKKIGGEIISADSMQIYKHMDIGSAKITEEEMEGIPHYLIDFVDPCDPFSVAEFKEKASSKITEIIKRNKIPMLVGGTGLYINSLLFNYDFTDTNKDEEYRAELEKIAKEKGKEYVHGLLEKVDEASFKRLYPNDLKRVIRALEVYKLTGKPISEINPKESSYNDNFNIAYFVLTMDRAKLYERINERVEIMMQKGLLEEVIKLKKMGYNSNMQSMKGIGYKELLYYLDNKLSLEEAIDMIKQGSRNYAKRQLTWFRKDPRVQWIDKDRFKNEEEIVEEIILKIKGIFRYL